jgi:hypothetical protein
VLGGDARFQVAFHTVPVPNRILAVTRGAVHIAILSALILAIFHWKTILIFFFGKERRWVLGFDANLARLDAAFGFFDACLGGEDTAWAGLNAGLVGLVFLLLAGGGFFCKGSGSKEEAKELSGESISCVGVLFFGGGGGAFFLAMGGCFFFATGRGFFCAACFLAGGGSSVGAGFDFLGFAASFSWQGKNHRSWCHGVSWGCRTESGEGCRPFLPSSWLPRSIHMALG